MYDRMTRQGLRFPTFSGEEMNHLITYLYSVAYIGKPGDPKRGATIFQEKRCVSCHGDPGKSQERIGPDLASSKIDSALGTIPLMWNHGMEMEGKMQQNKISWPRFEGSEMADLQAYLRSGRPKGVEAAGAKGTK
jgi:cytochrome c